MFENVFNGMFGKIAPGMCRLSMSGGIAVKTNSGYKTYNIKTGRLTNCANFVFDIGQDFFFCIPTNKAEIGDILLINGKPKCVTKVDEGTLTVINYEDSTVETVIPERHVFMGNTYFYGKIVSMFGDSFVGKGKKNVNQIMKYMMLSEMMKGNGGTSSNSFGNLMPLMLMSGANGFGQFFNGMLDGFLSDDTTEEDEAEDITEE